MTVIPTLLFFVLSLAACGPNQRDESIGGVLIPVPARMSDAPRDPFRVALPGFEAGKKVYQGKVKPEDIFNFYQEEMPGRGWEPKGTLVAGAGVMAYRKGNTSVLISVSSTDGTTTLAILVGKMETGTLEEELGRQ